MTDSRRQTFTLYAVVAALGVLVLILDTMTPLGVAVWILYVIPLGLTLFGRNPAVPVTAAAFCTLAMAITLSTDTPGLERTFAIINRVCGVAVIWTVALLARAIILSRNRLADEEWVRTTHMRVLEQAAGDPTLDGLAARTLDELSRGLGAPVGAMYAIEGDRLRLAGTHGLGPGAAVPATIAVGDGQVGEVARIRRVRTLEVGESYFAIRSALGEAASRHLLIAPLVADGTLQGVVELGLSSRPQALETTLMERVGESLATAIRSARDRDRINALLDETQRQAEELQAQQEELRVANEELEEQTRAVKASHGQLEQQQAELEATNAQLEQQTHELEQQALALSASRLEAERASRYKSEFLANMSHELRTPLNSALILARLLADNAGGRLSADEVRYAETIYASGNNLLALINDILDLSKIEAGAVAVDIDQVTVGALVETLRLTFEPLAAEKGLMFVVDAAAEAPETLRTDGRRLQQILTNLLSNAMKFTERGSVALRVRAYGDKEIQFAVSDSGPGIPADKFGVIFEAFRQADGSTHRRYGGTGLGLSISQELARMLGGGLALQSTVGVGSIFTLTLPVEIAAGTHAPPSGAPRATARTAAPQGPQAPAAPPRLLPRGGESQAPQALPEGTLPDDRNHRTRPGRLILVVEDDPHFARILYDLAHELDFDCVMAASTDEGMTLARALMPTGILLDVELPDGSGLALLDRLKHNPDTRHVPVHVISVVDHTRQALELGAIGYALKPVAREGVADAIRRLADRVEHRLRRVLVVEDDPQLRESIQALLKGDGVEIEGVGTAADALGRLAETSFDCVVLDLSLPDASGHQVLETMSASERYSFPPVIIYTGRAPGPEEEERLRRYSRSVIVKGARSPERLLDEVTLFLHQVESRLPPESQRMLRAARERDTVFDGRSILLVEDDVRNVFALTSVFEPRGARVRIARNGREALAAVRESRPDLVLMDVMMPEMDGLTATRELRREPAYRDLPIIVLTAKAMRDDYQESLAAGANDYMAKPIDVDKLVSLCRVWISR
jgi:signal transduction histidine kinase/DNA-binding response OmpR family regulator